MDYDVNDIANEDAVADIRSSGGRMLVDRRITACDVTSSSCPRPALAKDFGRVVAMVMKAILLRSRRYLPERRRSWPGGDGWVI